jgi:hypothetical protein
VRAPIAEPPISGEVFPQLRYGRVTPPQIGELARAPIAASLLVKAEFVEASVFK